MIRTETSETVAAGQLRAFVERIERLAEERKTIADDIKEVYAEAHGTGFDKSAIKTIIKIRALGMDEYAERSAILDLYMTALGMIPDAEARAPAPARENITQFPARSA